MKNKFLLFVLSFILFVGIGTTYNALASTLMDSYDYVAITYTNFEGYSKKWGIVIGWQSNVYYDFYTNPNSFTAYSPSASNMRHRYGNTDGFSTYEEALNYVMNNWNINTNRNYGGSYTDRIFTLKGSSSLHSGIITGDSILTPNKEATDDYWAPDPKWYETVWDIFKDYMTNPIPFGWFENLIDRIFGDDNNGGTISENVTITAPTLAPTPTPIPYSTVVIPKTDIITGDTVYETNYYYVNPSGTPIITSSPPTNAPASGGGGGGSTEYYPINGDPYSLPYLDWLNSVDIGENDYNGIDSIGDGLSAIDDIGSEYSDGMSAVQDSTGTLPTSWLLLIGIAAAIPLLAGIISRFLGG